jgi:hypothetical protein
MIAHINNLELYLLVSRMRFDSELMEILTQERTL